ncbi:MAG: UDP-N-acetylmuramoyl-L-alanine--D-glutamate ligase [Bacteroidota bacterium]|nr:UDP-N-acetylmuramoyl-L-alanine--D-glutamate ligase [Bacteroidota bacterium]MDP4217509.1 UDP-N-acetylmuramoyl-L-alanine--D-glutamate ligase [Bacteroidota bacterium]MDP4245654.1 UDP-N-acetylmuramoyl-L-alanine--D-glutamate ligase [Bacteroidota bacterium]MDP4252460.1 UDP-N-acetylmuramoyl-L-alanine--D-glutamate ligase [Bacteroidota bacterium]MDP4256644.1 UDP-N-acetylmuramoyl-L-alanine--D-glutamate ligase [Bacteroidota bacterium]
MNKRMVILGGGESGIGAALLARQKGYDVFVSDGGQLKEPYRMELESHAIGFEEGGHTEQGLLRADEVVKSPGIPEKNEWIGRFREMGIPVIGEIELAYRFKGDSKIIGITGSNGKSTTTALTYHICRHGDLDCAMVGNIGYSFARQVAEDPKQWYVAEISSFQLDDIVTFRPDIAVLTNITEDHLDRYDYRFENYIASKFRITMNQTSEDYFIYCEDDPVIKQQLNQYSIHSNPLPFTMQHEPKKGGFIRNGQMVIEAGSERLQMSIYDFAIKGIHNQYNTMAAGIAAATVGIRKQKIREAIESFEALEHRMEYVSTIRGVEFINDSKATNVNSTWYALESMTKPTILILGGMDKGNDYSLIRELVKEKVKAIVCMGVDNRKIHDAFRNDVPLMVNTGSADEAVKAAFHFAAKGDVVLLSPACASFDLFKNYEDRGKQFKEAVRDL